MRIASLLSALFLLCGLLALVGYPAVYFGGGVVTGVSGLLLATLYACVPLLLVLLVRRIRRMK